jgi:hypothetical protein
MKFTEEATIDPRAETAILFASYEERCVRVAQDLSSSTFDGQALIFYNQDSTSERVLKNLDRIEALLNRSCQRMPVSVRDPEAMLTAVAATCIPSSLFVDITCFNRENLFPFLWGCRLGIDIFPSVQFGYSAPAKYGTWLSRDYLAPHNIVGFGGALEFSRERALICIVGYEAKRAIAVIQSSEPSSITLVTGSIPNAKEFAEQNYAVVLAAAGSSNFEIREINVIDPQRSLEDLTAIVGEKAKDAALHIAPFNTKLSCLAVYALWLENQDIRIWNSLPEVYNIRGYSRGHTQPRYFRAQWK